jgi:hypothetical protein
MPESKKVVNYSPELTAIILAAYAEACADENATDETRAECIENLSAEHGKGVKSLRQKLVREKVYISKTYVSKAGKATETKDKIVAGIAGAMGVTEAQLGGLEKATKPALVLIRAAFQVARAELDTEVDES